MTGGTGLVGGELLPLLAAKPDMRISAVTRRRERISALNGIPGVSGVQGDLARPDLGLEPDSIAQLQASVTGIIHCAADTRFTLPLEQARAANVASTANLLRLARRCRRLEKFVHLSTVYVAGRSAGAIPEAPLPRPKMFSNTYQQSKYEAEELVTQAMTDLPAAIVRLSSIIGDSRNGRVRQFNYVHQILRLFPRNVLPVAPAHPEAPLDLISSDWAVPAIVHLFERCAPGRVYHLCAGPQASLTVRQMIDLTIEAFETHPRGNRWLPIRLPDLVTLEEYEAYVERARLGGDRLLNELLRVLAYFLPHLGIFQAFENHRTIGALAESGLRPAAIRTYYQKVVYYCLDTDWGNRPA